MILQSFCDATDRQFKKNALSLETVQRDKLKQLLSKYDHSNLNYEQFKAEYPLTRYAQWKSQIEEVRKSGKNTLNGDKIVRFQPTSGSSDALKFIPYTQSFLEELDQAIAPWLSSLYRKHPKLKGTTHYWSISWLPESQRKLLENENLNDDSALLSFSKRMLSYFTQCVPADVALAEHAEDAMFATVAYLVADENLGMISVWSPTFALQIFDLIKLHQNEIADVLEQGHWNSRQLNFMKAPRNAKQASRLKALNFEDHHSWEKLWPKLCLISSWDTASSRLWARKLQQIVPHVAFEGKGLWATEGVVTIPYDGHYPLAYQSHFYEFINLDNNQIKPSWELKLGERVSPIITTGSGLIRYLIDDELIVTHFYLGLPTFEFNGRSMTIDLVGEKIDQNVALHILKVFKQDDYLPISLLGVELGQNEKPHYVLLSEGNPNKAPKIEQLEALLKNNFHYELARNLGQLDEPVIKHVSDAWAYYKKMAMYTGMIEGNIKPEPLKKMRTMVD